MLLQERIEQDYNQLFINKNLTSQQKIEKSLLQQIVAEFQRRPNLKKMLTDVEVVSIISKYVKNNNELLKFVSENAEKVANIKAENAFLAEKYLPEEASEDFLIRTVLEIGEDTSNIGKTTGQVIGKCKAKNLAVDGSRVKDVINLVNNLKLVISNEKIKQALENMEKVDCESLKLFVDK